MTKQKQFCLTWNKCRCKYAGKLQYGSIHFVLSLKWNFSKGLNLIRSMCDRNKFQVRNGSLSFDCKLTLISFTIRFDLWAFDSFLYCWLQYFVCISQDRQRNGWIFYLGLRCDNGFEHISELFGITESEFGAPIQELFYVSERNVRAPCGLTSVYCLVCQQINTGRTPFICLKQLSKIWLIL